MSDTTASASAATSASRGTFYVAADHAPIAGLTISSRTPLGEAVTYFSLGAHTDISPETYPQSVLYVANGGSGTFLLGSEGTAAPITPGQALITHGGTRAGVLTDAGLVYTEVQTKGDIIMNEAIKAGEVFALKDLVPYQEGSIVNMDVAHNEHMKFVVMAFDEGTGLSEHAAPGNALVFALEGKATIGYEGKEYPISAGENFHFAPGGRHSVKANGRFKMALLLMLD